MFNYERNNQKNGIFAAILLVVMIMLVVPAVYADNGHIGSKPDQSSGDGIPNQYDPDFEYGTGYGEQNATGESPQGSDPAHTGDGIPNGGPIEGGDNSAHGGGDGIPNGGPIQGKQYSGLDIFTISGFLSILYL